ncbi:hypothetical protein SAMN05444397_102187 [Flavobacterium aquidurense]|nr:hypothetical protein SAMN05444397_102187 [Flavobacterium aquidurense]
MTVLGLSMFVQNKFSKLNQNSIMKRIIPILLILLVFTNCTDDDDKANPVVGTWKLVKATSLQFPNAEHPLPWASITDYSDKNIIYTFDARNTLTISENGEKETLKYEYKVDYLSGAPSAAEEKGPLVIIDGGSKMTYEISDKGEMILGLSYVDGANLYFVRQ